MVFWMLNDVPGFWDRLTEAGETPGVVARARPTRAETSERDQRGGLVHDARLECLIEA
jgi:hypothetical protein